MDSLLQLLIFSPLISSIFTGLFGYKISAKLAGIIACLFISLSFFLSLIIFKHSGIDREPIYLILVTWIKVSYLTINWAIYVDQLSAIMLVLVSSVSMVVHIYSLGYMAGDRNLAKFLAYLSLFSFFMLMLVSADNFLQLFFGWEGVGLCSYLLIGYYFKKPTANQAAIKAFLVNRVSDFAFIVAMVLIFIYTDSLNFKDIFEMSPNLAKLPVSFFNIDFTILDIICFLLLLGCMGKSAQFGLHIWLPDAMAGPTPVSALIHAATMVTAGVFLIARCSFLFEYSPIILNLMTLIGSITCFLAALIALCQVDIKKIIAYSTCSQLGYMFFACGVSAYQGAIFHLVTHGFFKALLFLAAGNVIHVCHEQNICKMGALRQQMPITYANFWLGSLAIIGLFPFAGFYSKDLILTSTYLSSRPGANLAFLLGIVTAILTAIYSVKIIILTFHGSSKLPNQIFSKVTDGPLIMNSPLIILTMGTLFAGMFGHYILNISDINGFFSESIFFLKSPNNHHIPLLIELSPLVAGLIGLIIGGIIYQRNLHLKLSHKLFWGYFILKNKFFIDEIYHYIFIKPLNVMSYLINKFDRDFIDGILVNSFSVFSKKISFHICRLQTGYVFNYSFFSVLMIILCLTSFIIKFSLGSLILS